MALSGTQILNGYIFSQHAGNLQRFTYGGPTRTYRIDITGRSWPFSDADYLGLPATVTRIDAGPVETYSGATLVAALDLLGAAVPDGSYDGHDNRFAIGGRYGFSG